VGEWRFHWATGKKPSNSADGLLILGFQYFFFGLLYFTMVWLVDYPLTRGERAIWLSGIAPSALMLSGVLGLEREFKFEVQLCK
jgi:hypothetical protein